MSTKDKAEALKDRCTLSNEELIAKCDEWVSKLCDTGGKAWTLRVPVDFNVDPDMLFLELSKRFAAANEGAEMREEIERLKAENKRILDAIAWADNKVKNLNWEEDGYPKTIERLRETLQKFTAQPYPDDVFLPISADELTAIHEMLMERFNMPIDRLAGHIGRELRKGIIEEARHALTDRQD